MVKVVWLMVLVFEGEKNGIADSVSRNKSISLHNMYDVCMLW